MREFLKNCGIVVLIVGELFLIVPFFTKGQSNTTLLTGWILVISGFILYLVLNKKIR